MPIGKVKASDPGLTPTEQRKRDKLLKQFTKGDGPKGNSKEYQDGWLRIFGKKEDNTLVFVWKVGDVSICHACQKEFSTSQIERHMSNDHFFK